MLPRNFTEEQQMFRDAYRRFLSAEIVPHMEKWREAGSSIARRFAVPASRVF
jgi:hypothetical protein